MFLTLFLAIAVITNAKADTHENIIYLFKDFNLLVTSDGKDSDVMDYISDTNMNFAEYKSGLCVVGNNNITIFTSSGRKTLHETINYSAPRIEVSTKYLLAYDLGGTEFSLYNSTACLDFETLDYPISGAYISDSGIYAIITKNAEYQGVVNIYDNRSNLIAKYEKNKYISDVAIDSRGEKIAVVAFTQNEGTFDSELTIYNIGSTDTLSVIEKNSLVLQCSINKDEYINVVFNNMFCSYDKSGQLKNKYEYSNNELIYASTNNIGTVLQMQDENSENLIIMFDTKGKIVYNNKINYEIKNIYFNEDYLFISKDKIIEIHNIKSEIVKTVEVDYDFDTILIRSNTEFILCNRSRAINFNCKY